MSKKENLNVHPRLSELDAENITELNRAAV